MNVNIKEKARRTKQYVADHKEGIVFTTIAAGMTAAYVAIVVLTIKEEQEQIEANARYRKRMNDWQNELRAEGTAVYRLADDRYLTVDKNGTQQTYLV